MNHAVLIADADLEVPQRANNVLDLFFAIVDSSGSAHAVSWRGADTTYQELDALSNQVANALIANGAAQGSVVAIFLSNPVDQIVATLGCLKAGCVFASLDVSHPAKRLQSMLETIGAGWVILEAATGSTFSALVKETTGSINVLVMGEDRVGAEELAAQRVGVHQVAEQSAGRVVVNTQPDDPCYIYFTSGSTGKPKAILGRIRGLAHFIQWEIEAFKLGPGSRVSQLTGPGFDVYLRDVFAPLCSGGTSCIPPVARFLDPVLLERWIEQARITLIHCVPSVFRLLLRQGLAPDRFPALQFVLLAGESLPPADANAWITCFGERIRLVNLYGPTETTLAKFFYRLPATPVVDTFVPIGMPIPGAMAILLDERMAPCRQGELGEIFIRTPYRTLGYYNDPALTDSTFVRDPSATGTSGVFYRTGDLARVLPDGNFQFAGRKDFQLKIHGNRIELGEIESRLLEHPGVREAVVLAREDRPGDIRLVAYYVPRPSGPPPLSGAGNPAVPAAELRKHLVELLPPFMVPALYVAMESLPLTANGKLDRGALPAPATCRPDQAVAYAPPIDGDEKRLCDAFAAVLGIDQIGRDDNFFEIGGNSLLAVALSARLQEGAARAIPATLIFANPTPATLAVVLTQVVGEAIRPNRLSRVHRVATGATDKRDAAQHATAREPIAIIAMAGRFPGAADVEQFWDNLCAGRDSITVFRVDELDPSIAIADRMDPAYVPARGVLDDVDQFDAGFFGINPREAQLMDPQHRIFLELCWECMERGGEVPDASIAPVGVFAGTYHATYLRRHVAAHPDLVEKVGAYQVTLSNEKDYIATRIAHKLNLTGPAISMYTACSTSLVAICQALDSLRAGSCDMALAGGVSIICPPRSGYRYQEGAMFSPDGHTRTFDARAQGTVFSDGAAVVLLKRLSDAIKDGNPIHAVILGGAVNNDGGHKASFTAPSSDGQAAVVAMAQANARVSPRSISYVEAHGTATPVGDPIEIEGLTKAFRRGTDESGFCTIGSVKSNVGHLVIAAGATGVIKTALALAERRIPASLHFNAPNPAIDFSGSPFVVNAALADWPSGGAPRRAGVSSFGVGGTNAHVVMEEPPARLASDLADGPQLLVLSARTPSALARAATRLAEHLETQPDDNLADVAWTLAVGRKAFAHRIVVVADDGARAAATLRSPEVAAAAARGRPAQQSDVVFLFPGQGATYPGMGRGLYDSEPAFRAAFDECAEALRGELGFDLRQRTFDDDPEALLPTAIMQPAMFAIEYALARAWMSHGLTPAAMIGHSVGEFVAATLAGVFTLPDALRLVARRGALMQAQPAGAMLSVRMALDALLACMPSDVSLAAENAPGSCVVAGSIEAIARFQAQLEARDIACRALRTSHAFHSQMMEPVVAPFRAEVAALKLSAPILPLVSTATGNWLDAANAMSPDYWAAHLRQPVRFATALGRVLDTPARVLLEVGPRGSLSALSRQHPGAQQHHIAAVATLADTPEAELASLRLAAGQLWSHGAALDPAMFDGRQVRRRVRLPTYPFERQRYWVEAMPAAAVDVTTDPVPSRRVKEDELDAPHPAAAGVAPPTPGADAILDRRSRLVVQLTDLFEDVVGFDLADAEANFIELGLDSLMLTQVSLQLQKKFATKVTFRQLMGECGSLDRLAAMLDAQLPPEPVDVAASMPAVSIPAVPTQAANGSADAPVAAASEALARHLLEQQMQLPQRQLATPSAPVGRSIVPAPPTPVDDAVELAHTRYDIKKAFGAIVRIHTASKQPLSARQRGKLDGFIDRYVARTQRSKAYTQTHRPHLADPRVVNGFRPLLKEIIYQIVVERSKGAHMWDLDGNQYVDATSGFGMNMFGWQPDFVLEAVRRQLDAGYDIGPQHPLAGEVARLICEITGHDRVALCNTGSEAVLGALRLARTVTGRETIVLFNGSYHGVIDEVIVRGTKKLRAVPAAPGILANTAEHVLVLDYGTPESLQIIRERAHELAAVLVEPVQSRRPDFQPIQFVRQLREITRDAGAACIFDEVITGFRAHPVGAQALFGVQADIVTYGKVIGGGFPIGVIAGKREYLDAIDGGFWQFGDASEPSVGVTYFAGTFVRHPLALAAAKASLEHLKAAGPALQERLNVRTAAMVDEINAFCVAAGAPIVVKHFASLWRTRFLDDHPLQDLLFAMLRYRGVHILDNFPCYLTTAHSEADCRHIIEAFKASVLELQDMGFLPRRESRLAMDAAHPIVARARLGRDPDGRPGWYVPDPAREGKYLKVGT